MSQFFIEQWPDGKVALAPHWAGMVQRGAFNQTLGPAWFAVIATTLAPPDTKLAVFGRRESDTSLSAALPFFRSSRIMLGLRMSILEAGSNLMSYHAEIVADRAVKEVISALLAHVSDWDVFHISNVPTTSQTAHSLCTLAREMGLSLRVIPGSASPYLSITEPWTQFLAKRNKKFRYKLRRRREQINDEHNFAVRWFTSESDTEALLSDMLAIESNSWKTNVGTDITARDTELSYHRRLLPYLAAEKALLGVVLRYGARPIAYSLCCSFNQWIGHLKTSFHNDFANASPGAYLIDTCVQKAFEIGATEFDFLGDAAPHKLSWTSTTRQHADYFLFAPTMKARLVAELKKWRSRVGQFRRTSAKDNAQ